MIVEVLQPVKHDWKQHTFGLKYGGNAANWFANVKSRWSKLTVIMSKNFTQLCPETKYVHQHDVTRR